MGPQAARAARVLLVEDCPAGERLSARNFFLRAARVVGPRDGDEAGVHVPGVSLRRQGCRLRRPCPRGFARGRKALPASACAKVEQAIARPQRDVPPLLCARHAHDPPQHMQNEAQSRAAKQQEACRSTEHNANCWGKKAKTPTTTSGVLLLKGRPGTPSRITCFTCQRLAPPPPPPPPPPLFGQLLRQHSAPKSSQRQNSRSMLLPPLQLQHRSVQAPPGAQSSTCRWQPSGQPQSTLLQ